EAASAGEDHVARRIVSTKKSVLLRVTPELLPTLAVSDDHLRALEAAQLRSTIGVPLLVAEKCLGVLFFESSSRSYGAMHLQLAEDVGRRTALFIENATLHRAAARAIHARDDVLRIVAHDLRNPLGSILMESSFLELPEETKEHGRHEVAEAISRSANRMKRL